MAVRGGGTGLGSVVVSMSRGWKNWATNVIFGYYVCMQPRIRFSFVRSFWRMALFVSFRDGAVARIFFNLRFLFARYESVHGRWFSGIRFSVLSPRFHFLFASTVIMNPFNVGQDPANRTAFGFWGPSRDSFGIIHRL